MKIKSVEILTAMNGTKRFTLFFEQPFKGRFGLNGNRDKISKFCEENKITLNGLNVDDFLDSVLSQGKHYITFERGLINMEENCKKCRFDEGSYHCLDCENFNGDIDKDLKSFCNFCQNQTGSDECGNCVWRVLE